MVEVEGAQFFRVAADIGEDALAFLSTSRAFTIGRTKVGPHGCNAFKDVLPTALDRWEAHEEHAGGGSVAAAFERELK